METYILIEYYCLYSQDDWHVIGVHDTKKDAILNGYSKMVETALRPHTLEFYRDRDGEFHNAIALPEISAQHWVGNERAAIIQLGFGTERKTRNSFDQYCNCPSHSTSRIGELDFFNCPSPSAALASRIKSTHTMMP